MYKHRTPALIAGIVAALLFAATLLLSGHAVAAPSAQVNPPASATSGPAGGPTGTPVGSPAASATPTAKASPTVRPYTGKPSGPPPTIVYTDSGPISLDGIWLGALTTGANIRSGPGPGFAARRWWPAGRRVLVYSQTLATNGEIYDLVGRYPEPTLYVWSGYVGFVAPLQVPAIKHTGHWIDVNLTQQTLIAFEDAQPVLLIQVSSGRPKHETPVGSWRIYWRLDKQDMSGGVDKPGDHFYKLKDVPWIQYFHNTGEALHGAYWHDNFGTPMSHGCVNLSDQNALWLFHWATLGTPVEVHN